MCSKDKVFKAKKAYKIEPTTDLYFFALKRECESPTRHDCGKRKEEKGNPHGMKLWQQRQVKPFLV